MQQAQHTIDSLEHVELALLFEESGIRFTEFQLSRLRPHFTPAHSREAISGQLRTKAVVFARRGPVALALALDDTFATLLVGYSEEHSPLRNVERYASLEMAICAFLSEPSMASNHRWSDREG